MNGSRRLRWVVLGIGAVLVAWGVYCTVQLLAARNEADSGVDALEATFDGLTPTDMLEGKGVDDLRAAASELTSANDRVSSPLLTPLRVLPVVGRQVRSIDALTGSAAHVVERGADALEDVKQELDADHSDGPSRIALARRLADIADDTLTDVADVDLGPDTALLGPIEEARDRFDAELTDARSGLRDARDAANGLADFLEGPSRYLVLAANNAEMRVGSGTFLSAGVLESNAGDLTLGDMTPTGQLLLSSPVPVEGDLADRWGWLEPGREWRNLGASPRFDEQAALAAEMWRASGSGDVDGVLALDPVALEALLAATGPVTVDGREISADDVVDYLLLGQYVEFDATYENGDRRDQLSNIAQATVDALDERDWDEVELFDGLRDAAAGRHVLAWSNDDAQRKAWTAARVDGVLDGDELMIGLHNRGANKLDYHVDARSALRLRDHDDGRTVATVDLELTNRAPAGLPEYVQGPYPDAEGSAEGLYQGLVVAQLPGDATFQGLEIDGTPIDRFAAAGADGASQVVAAYVEVPRGETATARLRFVLPEGQDELRVLPSARVPPVRWRFRDFRWQDREARTLHW